MIERGKPMNVYLYACLDAEGWAHSGLTNDDDMASVLQNIEGNFIGATHIMVELVPELMPELDSEGNCVRYVQRREVQP